MLPVGYSTHLLRHCCVVLIALPSAITALGRVRDVNVQRNQVTVVTNKAGEFAMGTKIYFYRSGKAKGSAQITQAFHTKAVARISEGSPLVGDDATTTSRAPKAGPKVNRVSFAATGAQSHEFIAEVLFEGQQKQQRKLTLNAEVAAQMAGASGFISLSASLIKKLDIVWDNGTLQVKKAYLTDRSTLDLAQITASDIYAKIKPPAELRSQTIKGTITFIKKVRDQPALIDSVDVTLRLAAGNTRVAGGSVYKLKVYCNELFAAELMLHPKGAAITETIALNPVDFSPGENTLEVRLVEVTEQGDLQLETDNNQLIGMLLLEPRANDRNTRVQVVMANGQDAYVSLQK